MAELIEGPHCQRQLGEIGRRAAHSGGGFGQEAGGQKGCSWSGWGRKRGRGDERRAMAVTRPFNRVG
jgi:hypothetical protein